MFYSEELVSNIISKLKELESDIDECYSSLQQIVSSDDYYGTSTTGLTNLSSIMTIHSEFLSFMSNSMTLYNEVYNDIEQSVDNIESSNIEIIYDVLLSEYGMVDQTDERWGSFKYNNTTLGSGGCGPSSVANGLIVTFGITDQNTIINLIKECANMNGAGNNVTEYLVGKKPRSDKYPTLNNIIDNAGGPIYYAGGSASALSSFIKANPPKDGEKVYFFGKMSFHTGTSSNYTDTLNLIDTIYEVAPNASITFYGMTGGQSGRAFGSASSSGHYVSLFVNVRDFKENGTVYLLDSFPRLLAGEENDGTYHGSYNFVSNKGDMRKFNDAYDVTRLSHNVLKVQLKNGESFDSKKLWLLGLSGGTQVAVTTNPSTQASASNTQTDVTQTFDARLAESMPTVTTPTDTTETNAKTRAKVDADNKARAAASAETEATIVDEQTTQPSRLSASLLDAVIPSAQAEEAEPEEYVFPETETKSNENKKANNDENTGTTVEASNEKESAPTEQPTTKAQTEAQEETPREDTTEVVGVVPTITTASAGPSQTTPTTSSPKVTVSNNTNPNGYTASSPTRVTANAGISSSGGNGDSSVTPTTTQDTPISEPVTETPTSEQVSEPTVETPTTTSPSKNVEQPVTTSEPPTTTAKADNTVVVNDSSVTEKKETPSTTTSNNSKTNKAVGVVGATLVAAGTAALILNGGSSSDYKVELNGNPVVSINMYQNYVDEGCKVLDGTKEVDLKPNVKLNLDNATPGTYKMTCSINEDSKTRYINVKQQNDNTTVGNVNIYYNDKNVLPSVLDDTVVTTKTTYTIKYNDNVSYIKYCVAEYGEKCNVNSAEKHNGDTFTIQETGKRVIYIEKYGNGNMVKEVRYINIK